MKLREITKIFNVTLYFRYDVLIYDVIIDFIYLSICGGLAVKHVKVTVKSVKVIILSIYTKSRSAR